ncbi:MAG: PTS sugar transporter subunit IIA [marine benthic group bacterium]|nr:PTS sugar transporter subunit IIA [Gemmatimonadota bacterium]MCL7961249.1 PTS sugar transporter subunit IIA [Candidatus Carthagonibacter metallireducens]MCL7966251.1 PTS sugar transporter subunit IIA [Gemmatimonadota bacterium]MCL7979626.1 PTS sugar transporter subunit IIA [Gemmatimonadota bacterium]MCL7985516.1 PTS sugar transporter subunit IIA [Gemmatimonadota bacterium]
MSGMLAEGAGVPDDAGEILDAIVRREALLSTGIGHGVALPHARCSCLASLAMAVGTTSEPVDFDSVDGAPVRLVWMLAGPERTAGHHVRMLGAVGGLLRDGRVLESLLAATTPGEFIAKLSAAESV